MKRCCIFLCCYKSQFECLLDNKTYDATNDTTNDKTNDKTNDECSLCLDVLSSSNCIRLYVCEHVFHEKCIINYLSILKKNNKINYFCPYCYSDQTAFFKYVMKAHKI